MLQYDYWTKVKDEIDKNYPTFNSRKPRGQHWYDIAIGSSLANISLHVIARTNEIKVVLWISDSKELFDYLYDMKDEIESQLGYELDWISSENNKSSSILIVKNTDVHDESKWDENINWHLTKASDFYDVFSERVKNFK